MIIVFNPAAGMRRASLLWRVLDVLVANGIRIELAETHRPGHAEALAREAVCGGASMVVAAGGDGTIAEVANGLLGSSARLGVIPLGTANVLAHELSLPFEPRAVAAALAFGRTRPLWPGVARGAEGTRLFVQMLGVGFDAQVVHHLPVALKRAFGRGAYAVQTLRELACYRFTPIRLRLDGEETQAASVIVSKGRLYGGRFLLAPAACAARAGIFRGAVRPLRASPPRCCMAPRCRSACWAARRACAMCVRGRSTSSATRRCRCRRTATPPAGRRSA